MRVSAEPAPHTTSAAEPAAARATPGMLSTTLSTSPWVPGSLRPCSAVISVATEITAEQGRKLPGTQGDVLKVVESMPGVARAAAGSAALVVWGAGSADTRIYVE